MHPSWNNNAMISPTIFCLQKTTVIHMMHTYTCCCCCTSSHSLIMKYSRRTWQMSHCSWSNNSTAVNNVIFKPYSDDSEWWRMFVCSLQTDCTIQQESYACLLSVMKKWSPIYLHIIHFFCGNFCGLSQCSVGRVVPAVVQPPVVGFSFRADENVRKCLVVVTLFYPYSTAAACAQPPCSNPHSSRSARRPQSRARYQPGCPFW